MLKTLLSIIVLSTINPVFAQDINQSDIKYLIIDTAKNNGDYIGYTLIKTQAVKGKQIYVLNLRYKTKKENFRSWLGSDADFVFSFYIIPSSNDLKLNHINYSNIPLNRQVTNLDTLRKNLSSFRHYTSPSDFVPILKVGDDYYEFSATKILGQAFTLKEDSQYFPKYGAESNIFELNFLAKPYQKKSIDSLRKIITKDSTSYKPFATYVEDFYDNWFIKKINKQENSFDFWIDKKNISSGGYSFGRVASEISFKINIGITDFTITPQRPLFSEEYFDRYYTPVEFNFKEFIDMKKIKKN